MNLVDAVLGGGAIVWQYYISGKPNVKKELQGAKYNVTKKGSSLDILVETSLLGKLEISIKKDNNPQYYFDKIKYYMNKRFSVDVHKNTGIAGPAVIPSFFNYSITTKRKKIDLRVEDVRAGKIELGLRPDKKGDYHVDKASFFDRLGARVFSYTRPIASAPNSYAPPAQPPASSGTIAVKPSP